MRIAVTGATGNVGTSLVRALAADGAVTAIVGIARRRPALELERTDRLTADVERDELTAAFAPGLCLALAATRELGAHAALVPCGRPWKRRIAIEGAREIGSRRTG
jgi:nucleoside-diphosphate-sugar epimerase